MDTKCVFSSCGRYRYTLWRVFDALGSSNAGYVLFIGLNPSTATDEEDDPTIRRCINFAKAWGYQAMCMTNLFAWRATDPSDLKAAADPVGDNDRWLIDCAAKAAIVIAAWGVHGSYKGRASAVAQLIPRLHCLGTTKDGSPRHPLYVRSDVQPRLWQPK